MTEEGNLTIFINNEGYNNPILIWWKPNQLKFPTYSCKACKKVFKYSSNFSIK